MVVAVRLPWLLSALVETIFFKGYVTARLTILLKFVQHLFHLLFITSIFPGKSGNTSRACSPITVNSMVTCILSVLLSSPVANAQLIQAHLNLFYFSAAWESWILSSGGTGSKLLLVVIPPLTPCNILWSWYKIRYSKHWSQSHNKIQQVLKSKSQHAKAHWPTHNTHVSVIHNREHVNILLQIPR